MFSIPLESKTLENLLHAIVAQETGIILSVLTEMKKVRISLANLGQILSRSRFFCQFCAPALAPHAHTFCIQRLVLQNSYWPLI
jgi:hypothetical protein